MKKILLLFILICTALLLLWPDFHPEKMVVNDHHWYYDLIIHGGYFFVAMFLVLLLRLKLNKYYQGIIFWVFSIVLELLQYFTYNRSVDVVDMGSNLVGILVAIVVFGWFVESRIPLAPPDKRIGINSGEK